MEAVAEPTVKPTPVMASLPIPLILADNFNVGYVRCGVQNGHAVSHFGMTAYPVPIVVVYREHCVKKRVKRLIVTMDAGLADANDVAAELRRSGYQSVEAVKSGTRLDLVDHQAPVEPFTYTLSRTRSWQVLLADAPIGGSDEADVDYFPELDMPCPCCGMSSAVLMPGNRLKWQRHHGDEPWCERCGGKLRLLPKVRMST